ncbi:MAG: hypothetical protein ACREI3_02555 [Nitrospirales bacterium]
MVQPTPIVQQILTAVRRAPGCHIDDVVERCAGLSWHQVFLEVARLSQTGQLQVTPIGNGLYALRLPSKPRNPGAPRQHRQTRRGVKI